jgi:photosystem II stability/assembly factor-like uncharacterized protein
MALRRACQALLERGEAPADARERALQGLPAFKLRAVATPAPRWVNIGPAPIVGGTPDTTWTARPRSGRVAAVAVDPSNSQHWLIGAAGGGIWETRDGGQSWAPRTDDQPVLTLGAIAFAPSAPKTVYAGTGEAVFSVDAYEGHGVLRSTDGGATWTHLASTTAIFLNKGFSDLAVDPTNSGIVIAAVAKAQLPRPTARASGIYKTVNGGRSWELKLGGEATDLEIDPGDFRRQYAAIGNVTPRLPLPAGIRDNGVYRSINAGDTWDPVTGPWTGGPRTIGRVELAIAPSNPDVLYVSIHDATPLPPPSTSRHNGIIGLWKTTNAWAPIPAWQQIPLGPTDNSSGEFGYCAWNPFPEPREVRQCFYNHELIVDPTDANVLYAGGIGLWRYDGATWQELALGDPARGIHADQHRMAWAGKRLIVGNDGGVWSTNNGGQRWLDHNAGLSTIQFWGGALAPTPELLALGGTQDNGTAVWMPPVLTWNGVIRGDAGPAAISPTRPRTHWAIAARGKGLEIWRTLDAGKTLKPAGKKLPAEVQQKAAIASPFVQCPVNHDVVLFADRALWRTTDFFASHPEQPIWTSNSAEANDRITAVAFAASDPTCQTYALARKGTLLMTTAGGQAAWRNLDPAGKLPKLKVPKGLAFDPRTPGTLYVVYSTFKSEEAEQGRVFRTTNALADAPTWTNIGPKNVDILHNSIALDPIDPRIVWVGTDLGVWRGDFTDGRTNPPWVHYGPEFGLPNVIVHDVKVHAASRQPVAFTHGRGAYILVDSAGWCAGTWAPTLGTNFGTCPP